MNPKTSLLNWLPALLLVALSGCSTTKLTDSWQAPGFQRKSMDKVLVVAMTANPTNRILFEEGFRKALQDKGIQATASHTAIGDAMPNRETVTAYVQKHGIDFVVVSDYAGTTVTKWVVPESVRTYYTGPYYPTYSGYWSGYGNTITMTRQSYVDEKKTTMLSTSIFEVKSEDLVWVGRSKSFNVDSIASDANDLANQIVSEIKN
jgi:hypothetical protein